VLLVLKRGNKVKVLLVNFEQFTVNMFCILGPSVPILILTLQSFP
jgi:hypothetical protein